MRNFVSCIAFGFVALVAIASAGRPTTTYGILRKPEFAGGDGDGAARGKIVNGFEKRPTVSTV